MLNFVGKSAFHILCPTFTFSFKDILQSGIKAGSFLISFRRLFLLSRHQLSSVSSVFTPGSLNSQKIYEAHCQQLTDDLILQLQTSQLGPN